ncbi:amphi-Trp domain-containing protein [Plantactinospora soyae]|uniref:Amphi-Trp domain-containing protein n=1 Tax=Plantactinospora soyae TaxID=1544732 RepID=A0A927M5F7_9ACTN|nr:amphi-Trp domain-containing protein [Plantactinospora soyae]MBE1488362.1 amphi-Trp domain-containing protein [Plantactinospora soyae]
MSGMEIYEDARTVSRADLAAWLRQLASQLESGAQIFYGAAGAVAVADQVHCELEIEREDGEISVEIEFSWASPEPAAPADTAGEDDTADEDESENEETGDAVAAEETPETPETPAVAATTTDGDAESSAGTPPATAPTGTDQGTEPAGKA